MTGRRDCGDAPDAAPQSRGAWPVWDNSRGAAGSLPAADA
jgi:hypothetical protein